MARAGGAAGAGTGDTSDADSGSSCDSDVDVDSDCEGDTMGFDDDDADPAWPGWHFRSFSSAGGDIARGKCKVEPPRRPRWNTDVHLQYDPSEFDLLDKFKLEADEVLKRALSRVTGSKASDLTPLACFMVSLPDDFLETWSSEFLENVHSLEEIAAFIKAELFLAVAGCSKQEVKAFDDIFVPNYPFFELHDKVSRTMFEMDKPSVGTPPAGERPFVVPKVMRKLQQLFRKHSTKMFFVAGESFVDLNDDKWPSTSPVWKDYGIKRLSTKKRKLQVIMHLLASVSTGFLLGGWLEEIGVSVADIVEDALLTLFDEKELEAIDVEKISALKIFIDRGYIVLAAQDTESNALQILTKSKAKIHATLRNSTGCIFRQVDRPVVQENFKGIALCEYGKKTMLNAWTSSGDVGVALIRQGQGKAGPVPLVTTDTSFPICSWTAKVERRFRDVTAPGGVRRTLQATVPHDVPAAPSAVNRAATAMQTVMASLIAVTSAQRTPDWFLGRLFRSSSTTTHVAINCTHADFFNSSELRELHAKCKRTARLEPREAVTEANAAGKVDQDIAEQGVPAARGNAGGRRGKKPDPTKPGHWRTQSHADLLKHMRKLGLAVPEGATKSALVGALVAYNQQANVQPGAHSNARPVPSSAPAGTSLADAAATSRTPSASRKRRASPVSREAPAKAKTPRRSARGHRRLAALHVDSSGSSSETDGGGSNDDDDDDVVPSTQPQEDGTTCDADVVEASELAAHRTFLALMMRRWFLRPFSKGANDTGPLAVGTRTEDKALSMLGPFLHQHSCGYEVLGPVSTHGLVARRDVPYAATSLDGLVFLSKSGADFGVAAVEVKTATTSSTLEALDADVRDHSRFVECNADSDKFAEVVPNPAYRTQAVHHAAVMGVDHVVVVFASPTTIKRCVLLRVTKAQRDDWIELLAKLQSKYMQFAFGPSADRSFPRLGLDNSPAYAFAGEHHTVETYVHLWRSFNEDVATNGTPPPFASLLPSISAYWNRHTGGCDIARKLVNSIPPNHHARKPISILFVTLLRYVFHNAFRLYQIVTLHPQFDRLKQYSDVQRNRACTTFHGFLGMVHKELGPFPHVSMLNFRPELLRIRGAKVPAFNLEQPASTRSTVSTGDTDSRGDVAPVSIWGSRQRNLDELFNDAAVVERRLSKTHKHECVVVAKNMRCRLCCLSCADGKVHKVQHGKKATSIRREPRRTMKYCRDCSGNETQRIFLCKKCWEPWHNERELQVPPCTKPGFQNQSASV